MIHLEKAAVRITIPKNNKFAIIGREKKFMLPLKKVKSKNRSKKIIQLAPYILITFL